MTAGAYQVPVLVSFDLATWAVFMAGSLLVPYPLHRFLAYKFRWEAHCKTEAKHYNDVLQCAAYNTILFVFGNYAATLNWIVLTSILVGVVGFSLLVELPFAKTSIPAWRTWSTPMWALVGCAVAVIMAFAAYHFYLAASHPAGFVLFYSLGLLVPVFLTALGFMVFLHQGSGSGSFGLGAGIGRARLAARRAAARILPSRRPAAAAVANVSRAPGFAQGPVIGVVSTVVVAERPAPAVFHIHHWQVFYALAFFTRFDDPVSNVAAGLVIGIYVHGVSAYGMDGLLEDGCDH